MSEEADRAYAAALELIREAHEYGGADKISFNTDQFRELSVIPEEIRSIPDLIEIDLRNTRIEKLEPISSLKSLETLRLGGTNVSNLEPILGLVKLKNLDLSHSKVRDLRPVTRLPLLVEGAQMGLTFAATPATILDENLLRISNISDDWKRTREAMTYLKRLPPWPEPLQQINGDSGSSYEKIDSVEELIEAYRMSLRRLERERLTIHQSREESIKKLLEQVIEVEAKVESQKKRADELIREADEFELYMKTTEAAFSEHIKQAEPSKLWDQKRREHRISRLIHFGLFFISMSAIATIAALGLNYVITKPETIELVLAPIGCNPLVPETCKGFSRNSFLLAATIVTFFTVLLWFTRLQMKLYLAERHLGLDARERIAFSRSYVGFLKEGDTSEEAQQQRSLVYAALFRPSSDGAIKEEGGLDPAISAAISKLLTR